MGHLAVDHVGDGLEAAVRVPRRALGLARRVLDLAHLVQVDERVEVGQVDAGEGAADREALALEAARRGGHRAHRAVHGVELREQGCGGATGRRRRSRLACRGQRGRQVLPIPGRESVARVTGGLVGVVLGGGGRHPAAAADRRTAQAVVHRRRPHPARPGAGAGDPPRRAVRRSTPTTWPTSWWPPSTVGTSTLSVESPEALGTAGALGNLRDWIDGAPVLLTNADAFYSDAGPVDELRRRLGRRTTPPPVRPQRRPRRLRRPPVRRHRAAALVVGARPGAGADRALRGVLGGAARRRPARPGRHRGDRRRLRHARRLPAGEHAGLRRRARWSSREPMVEGELVRSVVWAGERVGDRRAPGRRGPGRRRHPAPARAPDTPG